MIDKFGRHMLRSIPYSVPEKTYDSTQQFPLSQLKAPCIIYVRGQFLPGKSVTFYTLENDSNEYVIPVTGIIKHITTNTKVNVFINNQTLDETKILNQKVEKGDKIKFSPSSALPAITNTIYVKFVVNCNLSKDE